MRRCIGGGYLRQIANSHSKDVDFGSLLLLVLRRVAFFAHGLSSHLDAVGIVNQAVEDAIGDRGIADLLVPARNRQLGHEACRRARITDHCLPLDRNSGSNATALMREAE